MEIALVFMMLAMAVLVMWAVALGKRYRRLAVIVDGLSNELAELRQSIKEFDELAAESLQSQIDAQKAWTAGVNALAGFGAEIPKLNTEGLNHE